MENKHIYAMLISVGNYEDLQYKNLATYKMDIELFGTALKKGLKVPEENIRIVSGENNNGYVSMLEFTKAIRSFVKMNKDDIFVFYFSGHGCPGSLMFSDGNIEIDSIISFCERLKCNNTIMVLDCCYSGGFVLDADEKFELDKNISDHIGTGIEILSSTAMNDISRLGAGGTHSLFTGVLSSAMMQTDLIRNGRVSLQDICNRTRELIDAWNSTGKSPQRPVIRDNIRGTIFFDVSEDHVYKTKKISYDTEDYEVCSVEPLNSLEEKRLCAFVRLKHKVTKEALVPFTLEITKKLKRAEVYSSIQSERRLKWKKVSAIWCYFAYDEEDIVNHLYAAYCIWAEDKVRWRYYKADANAVVKNGVYIYENLSYEDLKNITMPTVTREEYIVKNKALLFSEMQMMEEFTSDFQEVLNDVLPIKKLVEKYAIKVNRIKGEYLKITNLDVPPIDLREWADEILNAVGYVLDIALIINRNLNNFEMNQRDIWLIQHAIRRYNVSLDKIKTIEKQMEF